MKVFAQTVYIQGPLDTPRLIETVKSSLEGVEFFKNPMQMVDLEGFTYLADHCPSLKKLKIIGSRICTDEYLRVLTRFTELEELHLYNLPEVTNEGISALSECPKLKKLVIGGFPRVKDPVLFAAELPKFKTLEKLAVFLDWAFDGQFLEALSSARLPLRRVSVVGFTCRDKEAIQLFDNLSELEKITFRCTEITNSFFEHVKASGRSLKKIKLVGALKSVQPEAFWKSQLPNIDRVLVR
jgi:hypothetical protein